MGRPLLFLKKHFKPSKMAIFYGTLWAEFFHVLAKYKSFLNKIMNVDPPHYYNFQSNIFELYY